MDLCLNEGIFTEKEWYHEVYTASLYVRERRCFLFFSSMAQAKKRKQYWRIYL